MTSNCGRSAVLTDASIGSVSFGWGNLALRRAIRAPAEQPSSALRGESLSQVTASSAISIAPARRRRRTSGAGAAPLPAVPVVQPVPGTASAQRAQELEARAARQRPHVLLDPDLASRPEAAKAGMPDGMSPAEIADRIAAKLLQGDGPILLCVPGTLGAAFQSSMLATGRAFLRAANGAASVASIPYPNGILDVVTRFLRIGLEPEKNVLALVLRRLRDAAPHRPILLAGESQGSWLIADTLREDPSLAAAVTRIVVFAKPGFVGMPESIGTARLGASLIPGTASGIDGVLEFRHTDDIVPSLFSRLGPHVITPYIDSLRNGRGLEYRPHHYDWHGDEAAAWLLHGTHPTEAEVHSSNAHPMKPERM
jgi:hypothetical protein